MLPGKEGEDRPRRTLLVAVVEVVGARIVEIYGALHKPQPEHVRIEVQVASGGPADGCNVMNALVHDHLLVV